MPLEYEVKDNVLRINCLNWVVAPSIEDSDAAMAVVIDKLLENKGVTKVILAEARENEYDEKQTEMLREIAEAYNKILNVEKIVSIKNIAIPGYEKQFASRFADLQFLVLEVLRKDPIRAYVKVIREINKIEKLIPLASPIEKKCHLHYLTHALLPIKRILENTKLIQKVKPRLAEFKPGDRSLYREIFSPTIRPNFMLTRFMLIPPKEARLITKYSLPDKTLVEIYQLEGKTRYIYHLTPLEFKLPEEKFILLDEARRYLAAHKPSESALAEPEKVRESFFNIGVGLIRDLASMHRISLSEPEIKELANILVRYTAGFGILELLVSDEKIQDIYINSPIGSFPIFIYHQDFEECETNLIPTKEDAEAWATRFRLYSGRPLDEANPVLDTELEVPGGRARVCAITRTVSPYGLGFAFRRHRERPWTIPLFIKVKMVDPLYAGLMSFIIDGGRSILIAGGRSSGKTSLLNALMLEIMRKFRILVQEDTLELSVPLMQKLGYNIERLKSRSVITRVEAELPPDEVLRTALRLGESALVIGEVRSSLRGDQEVIVLEDGILRRYKIKDLEYKDLAKIKVPTLDNEYKIRFEDLDHFVKHPKRKRFIEILTQTGRKVIVTPEHSVFTTKNFKIVEAKAEELKKGDPIVLPAFLPPGFNDIKYLDLLKLLPELRLEGVEKYIKMAIKKIGWKNACRLLNVSDVYMYLRPKGKKSKIPIQKFLKLMEEAKINWDKEEVKIKSGTSNELPVMLEVNKDFCRLLGYYVSEGWINGNTISFSNSNEKIVDDLVLLISKLFKIKPNIRKTKGFGHAYQIAFTHKPLALLLKKLECGEFSKNKRIPPFIFGLSREKICSFLEGLYRGDGSFTVSESSGNAVRYFTKSLDLANDLLYLLLSLGIVANFQKWFDKQYNSFIYCVVFKRREDVKKFLSLVNFSQKTPFERKFSHTTLNSVEFEPEELEKHVKLKRNYRHLRRYKRCSKYYLQKLVKECPSDEEIIKFANGDFFIDKVKEIKEILLNEPEYVYDLSVNPTQNFIGGFGGILLHNTEAKALFEAMRIGALANVVAGTIHGESAFGVFDRVVHDLGVPPTSFKAVDLITICNMLRSPDGLHRFRRVTDLIEVRKHWKEDPLAEGGFVPLMEYSAKEDRLKPTETLLYGESEVLDAIARRVKEWKGAWDRVWDNILLRAKIRETLVEYAEKLNRPEILEANFVVDSNEVFHLICEEVVRVHGELDSKMIYEKWVEWLKSKLKS
jgi:type IV secretory pathway ATPase VirB11/archaellum biosynthesis ATPase/intein/homing endonuclease